MKGKDDIQQRTFFMISERWSTYSFSAPVGWKGSKTTSGSFGATGVGATFVSSVISGELLVWMRGGGDGITGARGVTLGGATDTSVTCREARNFRGIIGAFFTALRGPVGAIISGLILGPVGIGFSSGVSALTSVVGIADVRSSGETFGGGGGGTTSWGIRSVGLEAGTMSLNRDRLRGPVGKLFSSEGLTCSATLTWEVGLTAEADHC